MFGRTVCNSMVTFLLESRKKPQTTFDWRSRRDLSERRVVVAGVVARHRACGWRAAAHDPPCAAITRTGRAHGVLVIEAARLCRQGAFAIAEHRTVLAVRERAARQDQAVGGLRLGRQLRQL